MSYCSFYCCYLIRSLQGGHENKTYVGSTPNPIRRLRQHNGELTQGAYRTRKFRPWKPVMLVYGFPSKIHALQFEWAWQKPLQSRHVKATPDDNIYKHRLLKTAKRRTSFMLTKMWVAQLLLNIKPFSLLPLKLRFLEYDMLDLFQDQNPSAVPLHIKYSVGSVQDLMNENVSREKEALKRYDSWDQHANMFCFNCTKIIETIDPSRFIECIYCNSMQSHLMCLAKKFTQNGLPTYGDCPNCLQELIWGDLIQAAKLRHKYFIDATEGTSLNEDNESDEEEDMEADDGSEEEDITGNVSLDDIDMTLEVESDIIRSPVASGIENKFNVKSTLFNSSTLTTDDVIELSCSSSEEIETTVEDIIATRKKSIASKDPTYKKSRMINSVEINTSSIENDSDFSESSFINLT